MRKIEYQAHATACSFCNRGGVAHVGWKGQAPAGPTGIPEITIYCCQHCAREALPKLIAAAGLPVEDLAERGEEAFVELWERIDRVFAYAAGMTSARAVKELAEDQQGDPARA